jgi:hypothetical protein
MANENKMVKRARQKAGVAERVVRSERRIRRSGESSAVTIETVREGLSVDVFKTVAANLEMSDRQLAGVLKIRTEPLTGD